MGRLRSASRGIRRFLFPARTSTLHTTPAVHRRSPSSNQAGSSQRYAGLECLVRIALDTPSRPTEFIGQFVKLPGRACTMVRKVIHLCAGQTYRKMYFPNCWGALGYHARLAFRGARNTNLSCPNWGPFGHALTFETIHAWDALVGNIIFLDRFRTNSRSSMVQRNVEDDLQVSLMRLSN